MFADRCVALGDRKRTDSIPCVTEVLILVGRQVNDWSRRYMVPVGCNGCWQYTRFFFRVSMVVSPTWDKCLLITCRWRDTRHTISYYRRIVANSMRATLSVHSMSISNSNGHSTDWLVTTNVFPIIINIIDIGHIIRPVIGLRQINQIILLLNAIETLWKICSNEKWRVSCTWIVHLFVLCPLPDAGIQILLKWAESSEMYLIIRNHKRSFHFVLRMTRWTVDDHCKNIGLVDIRLFYASICSRVDVMQFISIQTRIIQSSNHQPKGCDSWRKLGYCTLTARLIGYLQPILYSFDSSSKDLFIKVSSKS